MALLLTWPEAEGFAFCMVSYADCRAPAEGVAAISIGIKEKWESLCLLAGFSAILIGMEHRDFGLLKIPMPGESLNRTICIEKAEKKGYFSNPSADDE